MRWLINLFKEDHHENTGTSKIDRRIIEIKTRIAAFRSSYPWSEQSDKDINPSSQFLVETEEPKINQVEAIDLKAKLLGIKKQ